jgi:hypothetical protein
MENRDQRARVTILYDLGARISVITRAAATTIGLTQEKRPLCLIQGSGSRVIVKRANYLVPLEAKSRRGRLVTALNLDEITNIPEGSPPDNLDDQFPGMRHLTEPESLMHTEGPVEMLIRMDHAA